MGGVIDNIAVAPDGGIYLGGQSSMGGSLDFTQLARLHPNGMPDARYSADGRVRTLALDGSGNAIVGGDFQRLGGLPGEHSLARLGGGSRVSSRLVRAPDNWFLYISGPPDSYLRLEVSKDVLLWQPISTNVSPGHGLLFLPVTFNPTERQSFLRARLVP